MLTLILGGARSGKSDFAQRLAIASGRDVMFVATMQAGDDETRARISAHRATRPPHWRTVEAPRNVLGALESNAGHHSFVVVDCLTLWVSNLLIEHLGEAEAESALDATRALDAIADSVSALVQWCAVSTDEIVFVSNEVGLGVVPPYPLGRAYRDALGATNRTIASRADGIYWLTAGLALELKSLGALPVEAFGEIVEP